MDRYDAITVAESRVAAAIFRTSANVTTTVLLTRDNRQPRIATTMFRYPLLFHIIAPLWSIGAIFVALMFRTDHTSRIRFVIGGLLITIVCGIVFAGIGVLLGYVMGVVTPEELRVFAGQPKFENDPAQLAETTIGVVLGAVAGFSVGMLVGSTGFVLHSRSATLVTSSEDLE